MTLCWVLFELWYQYIGFVDLKTLNQQTNHFKTPKKILVEPIFIHDYRSLLHENTFCRKIITGQYFSSVGSISAAAGSGSCSLPEPLDFTLPREPGLFLESSFSSFWTERRYRHDWQIVDTEEFTITFLNLLQRICFFALISIKRYTWKRCYVVHIFSCQKKLPLIWEI